MFGVYLSCCSDIELIQSNKGGNWIKVKLIKKKIQIETVLVIKNSIKILNFSLVY